MQLRSRKIFARKFDRIGKQKSPGFGLRCRSPWHSDTAPRIECSFSGLRTKFAFTRLKIASEKFKSNFCIPKTCNFLFFRNIAMTEQRKGMKINFQMIKITEFRSHQNFDDTQRPAESRGRPRRQPKMWILLRRLGVVCRIIFE